MELPEELLIEILLELPVKSLMRFKCVCKHWISVIQSHEFVERQCHLSNSRRSKLLCFRKDPVTESHVISVLDRQTFENLEDLEWPPFIEEEGVEDAENSVRRIKIFGPVNGIYCIHRSLIDKWVGTLILWNPATREYKHIHPQISFPFPYHLLGFKCYSLRQYYPQQQPRSLHIGFGFDRTTNDFKVVVICQWENLDTGVDVKWHLRVYDNASDTWRTVYSLNDYEDPHPLFKGLVPPLPLMECDPAISHCLLNGVFHWACSRFRNSSVYHILTFDLTSEVLQLMNGPPLPPHPLYWSVWVLKDTIAAIASNVDTSGDVDPCGDIEVWMMTEYGVESSWAILYRFSGVNDRTPIGIPYDDRIFFDDGNGQLISTGFNDRFSGVNDRTPVRIPNYDRIFFDDGNGQLISTGFADRFSGVNDQTPVGIPYEDRIFFDDGNGQLISKSFDDDHQVKEHDVYGMTDETYGSLGILNYVEALTTLNPM